MHGLVYIGEDIDVEKDVGHRLFYISNTHRFKLYSSAAYLPLDLSYELVLDNKLGKSSRVNAAKRIWRHSKSEERMAFINSLPLSSFIKNEH